MHFLIVLIAVVALESSGQLAFIQRDLWLRKWYAALSQISPLNQNSMFKTLLFVLVPAAAVQLVIWSLADGVLVVLLELAVLLYSFGRGDLRKQIDTLESDIERSDLQAAFHDAAVFNIGHRGSSVEDAAGLFHELTATLPYRLFERTFAAVFWFFFLGAPVALAYRLLALHGDMQLDGDNAEAAAKQAGQPDGLIADDIANLEFHADSDKRADEAIDGVVDGVVEESNEQRKQQDAETRLRTPSIGTTARKDRVQLAAAAVNSIDGVANRLFSTAAEEATFVQAMAMAAVATTPTILPAVRLSDRVCPLTFITTAVTTPIMAPWSSWFCSIDTDIDNL